MLQENFKHISKYFKINLIFMKLLLYDNPFI